jgi:hypothetical protein
MQETTQQTIEQTQTTKQIKDYLEEIRMPALRKNLLKLYDDIEEKLKANPASTKFHHTYKGGLYDHTLEVLEIALNTFETYKDRFIRDIKRDDVVLVAFAHDLDKIDKYRKNTNQATLFYGQGFEYNYDKVSVNGTAEVVSMLMEYGIKMTDEILNSLTFSHGGWSVDRGKLLPLATILHTADMLSIATEKRRNGG